MIFIATSVFKYAVGRPHPLRPRSSYFNSLRNSTPLSDSVELLRAT